MKKLTALYLALLMLAGVAAFAEEEAAPLLLEGKKISFLGDSITTFNGYSNNADYNSSMGGNYVWYFGSNYVRTVDKTWWMQVLNQTGATLLVNNSWSGDQVVQKGVLRAKKLHNNDGVTPDIIIVYMGMNDYTWGVEEKRFAYGYGRMIQNAQAAYPGAEIFVCTLLTTTAMNVERAPDTVSMYNRVIREKAEELGCHVVDLFENSGITAENFGEYMGDKVLHPNDEGMALIASCVLHALNEYYQK